MENSTGVSVRVSKATYDALYEEQQRIRKATGRKPSFSDMLGKAWAAAMPCENEGDIPPAVPGETPIRGQDSITINEDSTLPREVLAFIRRHWSNPDCRECLLALARIFDVGDPEFIDSITRNCKSFARSSDLVEASKDVQHGSGDQDVGDFERRVDALSAEAQQSKPADLRGNDVHGAPARGKGGHERMGKRSVRKDGGGQ